MPSDKYCCIPGCSSNNASGHVLHGFPNPLKDPERFDIWKTKIGAHVFEGLSNEHIFKYRRVCHAHFEQRFLCRNNRISSIAVPTINVPDLPSSSILLPSTPLCQKENAEFNAPSSSKGVPSSSTLRSRRSPLCEIGNIVSNMPSTPKDVPSSSILGSRRTPINKKENYVSNMPSTSKDGKKVVKLSVSTTNEMTLIKNLIATKCKLRKLKTKCLKQSVAIKASKKIFGNPGMLAALENLPKNAKIFTLLQCRENKKDNKGRRFNYEEKILGLSLLKASPKGYRKLLKMFILPTPQTLLKLLATANIQPGINKNIFKQLETQGKKMKPADRLCILIFDEMAIKSNIAYNEKLDKIIGFITNGNETRKQFADHALVFMIRGLVRNYKQPIGYTFSAATTKGPELAQLIKNFVNEINKAGFTVVATICDQGSGNRSAINLLIKETKRIWMMKGEEPKKNIILINGNEIVPLYDPPHLIKCMRNNLLNKDLIYTINGLNKTAKWSHIEQLYAENLPYGGIRLIPKLTESHVKPAKMNKLKVKYATQIFSHTVACHMNFYAEKQIIPAECKDTADLLLFFDTLFDTLNGSYGKHYCNVKPALGPVTKRSVHHNIWLEAKIIINSMKFLKNKKIESVPTLKNWIWTLDGIQVLFKMLSNNHEITSIWTRHLNQDPIENFFGSIRSHGCFNTNPTAEKFMSAFSTLLVNTLSSVHAPGRNCEDDFATPLHSFIINKDCKAKQMECLFDINILSEISIINVEDKLKNQTIKVCLEYCSGYFAKKCKEKVFKHCQKCNNTFISKHESEYVKYREFEKKRWLCSPSQELVENISQMQDIIYFILKKRIQCNLLMESMKTIILTILDFDYIDCSLHKSKVIQYLLTCVCRFFIYNYCKNINKILCGKTTNIDDQGDILQVMAKKSFDKYLKRKIVNK